MTENELMVKLIDGVKMLTEEEQDEFAIFLSYCAGQLSKGSQVQTIWLDWSG